MTIKLTTETEQALREAIGVTQGRSGVTFDNGFSFSSDVSKRDFCPTNLVNLIIQAACNAVIRDGHLKWPLEVEQRHETLEEQRIRTALDEVPS